MYILHPRMYILHPGMYILHPRMYILHALYILHPGMYPKPLNFEDKNTQILVFDEYLFPSIFLAFKIYSLPNVQPSKF